MQLLQEFLEAVYEHVGNRTKLAVSQFDLDRRGSTDYMTAAFDKCKYSIASRVTSLTGTH